MKSVRFSQVVAACGKPEVYLLLTKADPEFLKALAADRIMMIPGENSGSKAQHGEVGYDEKQRGQLLLFPKSLKKFAGLTIVGIKYDLLAEQGGGEKKTAPKASPKPTTPTKKSTRREPDESAASPRKKEKVPPAKVIAFPKKEVVEEDDDDPRIEDLRTYAREALKALEKGNSVAAYNLIKRIVD